MPSSEQGTSHAATALVQRLLWNRQVGGSARPLPVVVLLGPWGSGKSAAIEDVSRSCGRGVIHASVDFDVLQRASGAQSADTLRATTVHASTVVALTRVVDQLSREWQHRPDPRFHRFTLSLLAAQASLKGQPGAEQREEMRKLIDRLTRSARGSQTAEILAELANAANTVNVLPEPAAKAVQLILPKLVGALQRRPLEKSARWISGRPEAEGAVPLDALVRLNHRVRDNPLWLADVLAEAFLADVRENHPRMAAADQRSVCACDHRDAGHHWHNWVLLLDNVDQAIGREFVSVLLDARERHLRDNPADHDPLLIVATSGRWSSAWDESWLPVWKQPQDHPSHPDYGARPVPSCRKASYTSWAPANGGARPRSPYLPVLLEPLGPEEIGAVLQNDQELVWRFVEQATGGLPGAVRKVAPLLRGRALLPSVRDVLESGDPEQPHDERAGDGQPDAGQQGADSRDSGAPLWRTRLNEARLAEHLRADGIDIDQFIDAAPFATAPWLVPDSATSRINQPDVGQILTELRTALWVTVPQDGGGTAEYAVLHPWIAGALSAALVQRDERAGRPTYSEQFAVLLQDPDTAADFARTAYCRLALSDLSTGSAEVGAAFAESFDQVPHREWIRQLKLAARAPVRFRRDLTGWELYLSLVDAGPAATAPSSPVENVVRRLLTAEWLNTDPFAVPDHQDIRRTIHDEYTALARLSQRADVRELRKAAENAANWRL
jgi:hypothetical protein